MGRLVSRRLSKCRGQYITPLVRLDSLNSSGITPMILLIIGLPVLPPGIDEQSRVPLVLLHGLIEEKVVLEVLTDEEVAKSLAGIGILGLVIGAERAGVIQLDDKLVGKATAQSSVGVIGFFFIIRQYFYSLAAARRPYQEKNRGRSTA